MAGAAALAARSSSPAVAAAVGPRVSRISWNRLTTQGKGNGTDDVADTVLRARSAYRGPVDPRAARLDRPYARRRVRRRVDQPVLPRGHRARTRTRRPAAARVPAGRPRRPRPAPAQPHQRWVDRGGDQALPGGVARPAWHRALQPHRNAYDGAAGPGRPRGAGRVSQAVPGRFDHPRFRTPAPHRIRRRAVGHAGPELRRIPDPDLPLAVPGGRGRQLHHRRHPACARRRHGGLRAHLPAHGREDASVL